MLAHYVFKVQTENTKMYPFSFCFSLSLTAMVAILFPAPQFSCHISRDNVTKCLLPRRTRKIDVHVCHVAPSDLRKTASEKYCSHHDY